MTRLLFFFFQAEDGIRDYKVTGVQTCALPILEYYVYRADSNRARRLFGVTPDMIEVYSQLTGVRYPWAKYAQTTVADFFGGMERSEEHTSELQSPCNLVCRLLLEKKKKEQNNTITGSLKKITHNDC